MDAPILVESGLVRPSASSPKNTVSCLGYNEESGFHEKLAVSSDKESAIVWTIEVSFRTA